MSAQYLNVTPLFPITAEEPSEAPKPKRKGGRNSAPPEAKQSPSGSWFIRTRRLGVDIYVSGCKTKKEAEKQADRRLAAVEQAGAPKGRGPERTTLAQALQDFAFHHLPRLKGAPQEVRRINNYLRLAGLSTLKVTAVPDAQRAQQIYFEVTLQAPRAERSVPNGLAAHRKQLLTRSADSERLRAVLSTRTVASVSREDLQRLVDTLQQEGKSPATIALERALLRRFFYHAENFWNWQFPRNPATGLHMPTIDNASGRAVTLDEEKRLEAAMAACKNKVVLPVTILLRETAMRTSEPLAYACWKDVDWERCVLTLPDSKNGRREVPLSAAALQALRDIGPGEPDERIVRITYEALKAAWKRACQRAAVKNLRLYDLRHTGATRLMLETGNVGLVKALTGHKTMAMLERYIRIGADDVVAHFRGRTGAEPLQNAPEEVTGPVTVHTAPAAPPAPAANASVTLSVEQLQALVLQGVQAGLAQFGAPNQAANSTTEPPQRA